MKPETELQTAIVKALRQMGVWVMVMNVTKRRGKRGVNCGEPGMPDLCIVSLHAGVNNSGWLEVKLPGGKLDPEQVAWHQRAQERGIHVGVARSVSEAVAIVQSWTGPRAIKTVSLPV